MGQCENGLYPLHLLKSTVSSPKVAFKCHNPSSSALWHHRLGHPSKAVFEFLCKQSYIPVLSNSSFVCDHCSVAKSHKLAFHESISSVNFPFNLVHSDIWGPSPVSSFNGFKYYLVLVDELTKFSWIYPLKTKAEVPAKYIIFSNMVHNQFNAKIKILRTDNGGEFVNTTMQDFLNSQGTIHQRSCPHTPEQNGVAERKHRHLIETIVALLHQAQLPNKYWLEALCTAVYLINRMPTTLLKFKTPFEALYNKQPNYSNMRVFGCLCYPWLRPYSEHKLQPRSTKCLFLGYCTYSKLFHQHAF